MADWGLLQGLGQGLQMAGNVWTDKSKEELRNKLLQEREAREEQRMIAREDRIAKRQADTVAGYRPEIDSSGVLWVQGHNAAGDARGEKRLATPSEIDKYKMERDKEKITLENLTNQAAINRFKAGRLETEAAQDDALFGARKGLLEAQAYAANARGSNTGSRSYSGRSGRTSLEDETVPVETSDLVSALVDQEKKLLEEAGLSIAEQNMLAKSVLREARAQGKDPVDTLREALPHFVKAKKGSGSKTKSGLL